MNLNRRFVSFAAAALLAAAFVVPSRAQVGQGLIDFNTASEAQLTGLPHMTPALVGRITADGLAVSR